MGTDGLCMLGESEVDGTREPDHGEAVKHCIVIVTTSDQAFKQQAGTRTPSPIIS